MGVKAAMDDLFNSLGKTEDVTVTLVSHRLFKSTGFTQYLSMKSVQFSNINVALGLDEDDVKTHFVKTNGCKPRTILKDDSMGSLATLIKDLLDSFI